MKICVPVEVNNGLASKPFGHFGSAPMFVVCDLESGNLSLDEAVNAITGYDLPAAKELVTKAYNEALAAGDIKETDKVVGTNSLAFFNLLPASSPAKT